MTFDRLRKQPVLECEILSVSEVTIIDYGIGNLLSVRRGLEHCEATVKVTADPDVILSSSRVILPGVGAFADGMIELRRLGLDTVVCEVASRGVPLLGICLGMQLLLENSEEFSSASGLGIIPGRVVKIPSTTIDGQPQKVPHIGWNELNHSPGRGNWKDTPLQKTEIGDAVYFVHSFMAMPTNPNHRIADCY